MVLSRQDLTQRYGLRCQQSFRPESYRKLARNGLLGNCSCLVAKRLPTVPAGDWVLRTCHGVLGNCPVGRLAIGIATDICRYRSVTLP